ncbi:MAG: M48 family metalloprotease [Methylophilaceae bacterium]
MPVVDPAYTESEMHKQRELVLDSWLESYRRLQGISSRLVINGTALCGEHVAPYFGIDSWSLYDFPNEWWGVARTHFRLSEELKLLMVARLSPADRAGMKEGDVLEAVNNQTIPKTKEAKQKLIEDLKQAYAKKQPVEFSIRRDKETMKFTVKPTVACDSYVQLVQGDAKNAFADGAKIVILKGMMEFFKSDEEIALVISHEMAHNAMGHLQAKKGNAGLGMFIGLLFDVLVIAKGGGNTRFADLGAQIGAGANSVSFEQEADYVGLYFMAQAGYSIEDAPNFWRRMATADPSSITLKSSHPTTSERFVALESTITEINGKVKAGKRLKPEMKSAK